MRYLSNFNDSMGVTLIWELGLPLIGASRCWDIRGVCCSCGSFVVGPYGHGGKEWTVGADIPTDFESEGSKAGLDADGFEVGHLWWWPFGGTVLLDP